MKQMYVGEFTLEYRFDAMFGCESEELEVPLDIIGGASGVLAMDCYYVTSNYPERFTASAAEQIIVPINAEQWVVVGIRYGRHEFLGHYRIQHTEGTQIDASCSILADGVEELHHLESQQSDDVH